MKKSIKLFCLIIISAVFSYVCMLSISMVRMQKSFDSELYGNVIRLHILANSDSERDQKAKLQIKDAVVDYVSSITADSKNADEAALLIESNLENIASYVQKASQNYGYDYTVNVDFSKEKYPIRYYDGFSFPSGKYRSLRILLGEGGGKNWWCVLYPSICNATSEKVPEMLEDAGVSGKTVQYICDNKKYKIRFRLLELLGF